MDERGVRAGISFPLNSENSGPSRSQVKLSNTKLSCVKGNVIIVTFDHETRQTYARFVTYAR